MSELKVNSIKGTGASSAAITVHASDGTATGKFTNLPNRNLIINGDQTFSQRVATTETTPGNGDYCLDRYKAGLAQAGKWKYQQVTESPDEFTKSIVLTSTSAYTPTSNDHFFLEQLIEGSNVAHLAYGTASAKTTTLSFWIKSSIGTGTYGGAISNSAGDRSYVWAVSVTGTGWQRVNVVIPGDTSGTWVKDNGIGLKVRFNLGNAGTWSATAGSWGAGNKTGNSAHVHLVATNAATLHITGVQLEVGDTATDFEHRSYSDELSRCQRYYYELLGTHAYEHVGIGYTWSSTSGCTTIYHPQHMRAAPTGTVTGNLQIHDGGDIATSGESVLNTSPSIARVDFTGSGFTVGRGCQFRAHNDLNAKITMSAEL